MSKVLIVGDTHFSAKTPVSRKDNYPETLISKLISLGTLIKEHKVSDVIFLGDLFNTKNLDLSYFTRVFQVFKDIKLTTNVKFYTVVGNHDLLYRSRELLVSSPITLLNLTNVFETTKEQDTVLIGGLNFTFVDYSLPVSEIKPLEVENAVLIGHYFYENGWNDTEHTLTDKLCKDLGYKFYFLGHDHTPYEPIIKKEYAVHRPGSFSRGTSMSCQVRRNEINVCLFDTETLEVSYIPIPNVLKSNLVYKDELLLAKELDHSLSTLNEDFTAFLEAFKYDGSEDIKNTLEALEIDQDVKDLLIKYLKLGGLIS